MTEQEIVLRLSGTGAPDGLLSFAALGRLVDALQELSTRVGRWSADQDGPGRSYGAVEAAGELRLLAVSTGSTVLRIGQGALDVLPVDDGLEQRIQTRFADVLTGLAVGEVPAWVTSPIRQSVVRVIDALDYAAKRVELVFPGRSSLRFQPRLLPRDRWTDPDELTDEQIEVVGRLEAVDLDSRRFRLRDDVGNRIPLHHVNDATVASLLIGRRVIARGLARVDPYGTSGVEHAAIEPFELPASWTSHTSVDYDLLLGSALGPDLDGAIDFTDEEFAEFLAATDH